AKAEEIIGVEQTLMEERNAAMRNAFETAFMAIWASIGAAIVLSLIVAASLGMMISRGVNSALKLANSVAEGDLSASATVRSNDEIRDLVNALNGMTGKLREVVSEVTVAARNVASGSEEMSA